MAGEVAHREFGGSEMIADAILVADYGVSWIQAVVEHTVDCIAYGFCMFSIQVVLVWTMLG